MDPFKFKKSTGLCSSLMIFISIVILSGGCQNHGSPRLRFGAFFGSPGGMKFTEPANLGRHSYEFTLNETNGMVYTCRGGFIDIAHVREAADRTAYLQKLTYENLMDGNKDFSFQVIEPSRYRLSLSYPENWNFFSVKEKEYMAKDASIELAQYLAHTSLIWHEIITWYGFASSGIFPDTISAFSPEDPYSDVLGVQLAARAMRDTQRTYDEAMTELIFQTLQELDVQSACVAHEAEKQIVGNWYSGGFYFFVHMKKRNLNVGVSRNDITPWLVPGICPDAKPQPIPVPRLDAFYRHGFGLEVEIEPNVLEKNKIYRSIGLARNEQLKPEVHFLRIMDYISLHENGTVMSVAAK